MWNKPRFGTVWAKRMQFFQQRTKLFFLSSGNSSYSILSQWVQNERGSQVSRNIIICLLLTDKTSTSWDFIINSKIWILLFMSVCLFLLNRKINFLQDKNFLMFAFSVNMTINHSLAYTWRWKDVYCWNISSKRRWSWLSATSLFF